MTDLIEFFIEVGKLKELRRSGWLLRKIENPETVAEHSFRSALMAWVLGSERGLDSVKLLKMLLIHDLVEVYAGDETPYDDLVTSGVDMDKLLSHFPRRSKEDKERLFTAKHARELKALNKLTAKLPPNLKTEMHDLWMEYDIGTTEEGRFARQLDRIESLLQALEYEKKYKKTNVLSFWYQLKELADDPVIVDFMHSLDDYFYAPAGKKTTKKK